MIRLRKMQKTNRKH